MSDSRNEWRACQTSVLSSDSFRLQIDGHEIDTEVFEPSSQSHDRGSMLFLHGAGMSSKKNWQDVAASVSELGFRSITFSFPGHGNSSGELIGTSLEERRAVSQSITDYFELSSSDGVVGVSMGAHSAVGLIDNNPHQFDRVALLVPAAYSKAAETIPFGPDFSAELRREGSYEESENWRILRGYMGKVAVVASGSDDVIPPRVIELYRESASAQADLTFVEVANSPHQMSSWISKSPERSEAVARALANWQFEDLADLD